jgi:hypothetical protein
LWGGNWVVPPYMELRAAGYAVDLAPRCVAGAVNVLCGFNAPYLGDPKAIAEFLGPRGAALVALADSGKLPCGNQIFNPTSMCAYAKSSTQPLRPCFENSTRAIDPSKNQPNRHRFE